MPNAAEETVDLRKQIRNLKNELFTLTEGTEEYNRVLRELGNAELARKDAWNIARNSADDIGQRLTNLNKVSTDIAAGFSAGQAAMQLFGIESEGLEKTMVKLQAGIALVQGLEGLEGMRDDLVALKASFSGPIKAVGDFIKGLFAKKAAMQADTVATQAATAATHGFRTALIATGIGAIVVALGALVANWDKVKKAIGLGAEAQTQYKDATEISAEKQKILNNELAWEIFYMEQKGASQKEIAEKQVQFWQNEQKETNREIQNLRSWLVTYSSYQNLSKKQKKIYEEKERQLEALTETQKNNNAELKNAQDNLDAINKKLAEDATAAAEEAQAAYNKMVDDIKKSYQQLYDVLYPKTAVEKLRERYAQEQEVLDDAYAKKLISYEQYLKDTAELSKKYASLDAQPITAVDGITLPNQVTSTSQPSGLATPASSTPASSTTDTTDESATTKNYQAYEYAAQSMGQLAEQFRSLAESENALFSTEINGLSALLDTTGVLFTSFNAFLDENTGKIETSKMAWSDWANVAGQAISGIGNTFSAYAKGYEEQIEAIEGTDEASQKQKQELAKKQKNMQIAAATMQMLGGAVSAFATAMQLGPIAGPIIGAVNAAAVLAMGALNIAQIKKQDPLGNSSSGGEAGTGAITAPTVQAPTIDSNALSTQLSTQSTIDLNAHDSKVYVVETDIAEALDDSKVRVEETTF